MKRVLVTGGAGYVGSTLVPKLLKNNFDVTVLDLFLYEPEVFKAQNGLTIIKGDIRDTDTLKKALKNIDIVIHLACISNDPSFELNPSLGREINLDAFEPLVKIAKNSGVKRFINASSSSVYGVSDAPQVIERSKCLPLTDYSRFKLQTENILIRYSDYNFVTTSIRSATVCGYSPRQRLDVIVNILTNHAYNRGEIIIEGGDQKRPNVHIDDLTDVYLKLCTASADKISNQVFNFGGPNYTVKELATLVKLKIPHAEIIYKPAIDERSYQISSDKIKSKLGYIPKKSIPMAISDLINAFEKGLLINPMTNPIYFNIRKMKELLEAGSL